MPSKPSASKKKVVEEKAEKLVQPSNGLAVTSMSVGIFAFLFGWVPFLGVMLGAVALIFGIVALVNQQHKGMAIAGIVLGALALMASFFIVALGFVLLSYPEALSMPQAGHDHHFFYDSGRF